MTAKVLPRRCGNLWRAVASMCTELRTVHSLGTRRGRRDATMPERSHGCDGYAGEPRPTLAAEEQDQPSGDHDDGDGGLDVGCGFTVTSTSLSSFTGSSRLTRRRSTSIPRWAWMASATSRR